MGKEGVLGAPQGLPEGCTAECWPLQPAGVGPSEVLREDRDVDKREVPLLALLLHQLCLLTLSVVIVILAPITGQHLL